MKAKLIFIFLICFLMPFLKAQENSTSFFKKQAQYETLWQWQGQTIRLKRIPLADIPAKIKNDWIYYDDLTSLQLYLDSLRKDFLAQKQTSHFWEKARNKDTAYSPSFASIEALFKALQDRDARWDLAAWQQEWQLYDAYFGAQKLSQVEQSAAERRSQNYQTSLVLLQDLLWGLQNASSQEAYQARAQTEKSNLDYLYQYYFQDSLQWRELYWEYLTLIGEGETALNLCDQVLSQESESTTASEDQRTQIIQRTRRLRTTLLDKMMAKRRVEAQNLSHGTSSQKKSTHSLNHSSTKKKKTVSHTKTTKRR
ncbi:hypothetical protein [Hugenholtzia roseola]|uniref:hypothetical protein n=1 Tax=Hugenholtzia roseola TaxID=1002 RepID=UPI00040B33E3|nr:hypothetical protein [Hugenholtzia roseola]